MNKHAIKNRKKSELSTEKSKKNWLKGKMANARSIEEYVGKMAVLYARWRDEELDELAELKRFKKDQMCPDCHETLLPDDIYDIGEGMLVLCSGCQVRIHEEHAYCIGRDAHRLCDCCKAKLKSISTHCPRCKADLDLEAPGLGVFCSHCLHVFCRDCSDSEDVHGLDWPRDSLKICRPCAMKQK